MGFRILNRIILVSIILIHPVRSFSQNESEQTQSQDFSALVGHYELTLNGRTLAFNIFSKAEEREIYFQALSGRPGGGPPAKEMVPVEEKEYTFISEDPAGRKVEFQFEIDKAGRMLQCVVHVPEQNLTGEARKLSDVPEAVSQPVSKAEPELTGTDIDQISQVVKSFVDQGKIIGGEILVLKDNRVLLHEAHGWNDRERKIPLKTNSIYRIRSMTKPFIGTAILMLYEDARLKLDDPVSNYLPSFKNEKSGEITIKECLLHKAGFEQTDMPAGYWETGNLREAVDLLGKMGPPNEPGQYFRYSDKNSATLGAIVCEITGKPVEAFIEERILKPLGMHSTFSHFHPDSSWAERMNSTYRYSGNGFNKYWDNTQQQTTPFFRASGGLYTTTMDYARFLQFWMDKGVVGEGALLNKSTIDLAINPPDRTIQGSHGYGLHWELFPPIPSDALPAFGHGGSDGTLAMAIPSKNLRILFFTQSRGTRAIGEEFKPLIQRLYFE